MYFFYFTNCLDYDTDVYTQMEQCGSYILIPLE